MVAGPSDSVSRQLTGAGKTGDSVRSGMISFMSTLDHHMVEEQGAARCFHASECCHPFEGPSHRGTQQVAHLLQAPFLHRNSPQSEGFITSACTFMVVQSSSEHMLEDILCA